MEWVELEALPYDILLHLLINIVILFYLLFTHVILFFFLYIILSLPDTNIGPPSNKLKYIKI